MGILWRRGAIASLVLFCSGCGTGVLGVKADVALSAAPLEPFNNTRALDNQCILNLDEAGQIRQLTSSCSDFERSHVLAYESQVKCSEFVTKLFGRAASTNVGLDILTTFLTSAASVTTPTRAAHVLSAGAAVSSGTKLSISNEYFNSLAISHIVQAIQQSYTTDMAKYLEQLDGIPREERVHISFLAEIPRIQAIHSECSLPAAEGTIATTLQTSNGKPSKPSVAEVGAAASYRVIGNKETLENVANGIAMAINASTDLRLLSTVASVDKNDKTVVNLSVSDAKIKLEWGVSVSPTSSKLLAVVGSDGKSIHVSGGAPADKDTVVITARLKSAQGSISTVSAAPEFTQQLESSTAPPRGRVARAGESLQSKEE